MTELTPEFRAKLQAILDQPEPSAEHQINALQVLLHDLCNTLEQYEDALMPFAVAYRLFFLPTDRDDKSLYWFENTSRTGKQHPNFTLFVQDFRRAHNALPADE